MYRVEHINAFPAREHSAILRFSQPSCLTMNQLVPLISLRDPPTLGECAVTNAVNALASAGIEQRGAIFTKREVVEFILDLAGYVADRQLHKLRLLEPSFGNGDFLLPAIERLLKAWKAAGEPEAYRALNDAVMAVELHRTTFEATRSKVEALLKHEGIEPKIAEALAQQWLVFGDFLLLPVSQPFDFVIGNPPYVRQELIADALMLEYRARYRTIYDRADIYIPFIERSLLSLSKHGQLGFICADRWMKNRYGAPLRQMISEGYHLKIYVDMVDTPAFHSEVVAYPGITIIVREKSGVTRIAHRPAIDAATLSTLAKSLLSMKEHSALGAGVKELKGVVVGAEPWILESSDQLALARRLEKSFPTLEESRCKVGIGVATGADKAFIGRFDDLDVELDRKLPLVMTEDILDGTVKWQGFGVINPFAATGELVDLADYPKLRRYLNARRGEIARRHCAQKAPAKWFRTIDRIYPEHAKKQKLLIPDIKGKAHIVYENEGLYPHHNLYFITSDDWDLQALQAVLLSGIARLFVAIYSTKMRGGYMRFQAQYLRRIRVPQWADVPNHLRLRLKAAAKTRYLVACNQAAFELYGLSESERTALGGNG
jgi:hypothetical protein